MQAKTKAHLLVVSAVTEILCCCPDMLFLQPRRHPLVTRSLVRHRCQ